MSIERESLSELEAQRQGIEAGIVASRDFMAKLGVTDVMPNLHLDPQNITQFREKRPLVVAINRRFLDIHIPAMQVEAEEVQVQIDNLLVETVQRVDEDLAVANTELEGTQRDVDAGFLPPTILTGLHSVVEDLRLKQTQPDYIRAREILEARKQVEQPTAPVEPEVPADLSEKARQIEMIRQNLGNPDAFDFPAGMTVDELFDQDIEGAAADRVYNALARADISSVEVLLSKSVEELVGKPDVGASGVRNFGIKSLEITLAQLLKKGILPKEQEPRLSARQRREEFLKHPLPESRLLALSAFLDEPTIDINQIRDVLGPNKNGKPLTYWNCVFVLTNAVIFIKSRMNRDIAEDDEKEVWNTFREFINGEPHDEVKRFYEIVKKWYYDQKVKAVSPLTIEGIEGEVEIENLQEVVNASDAGVEIPDMTDWEDLMNLPRREKMRRKKTHQYIGRFKRLKI